MANDFVHAKIKFLERTYGEAPDHGSYINGIYKRNYDAKGTLHVCEKLIAETISKEKLSNVYIEPDEGSIEAGGSIKNHCPCITPGTVFVFNFIEREKVQAELDRHEEGYCEAEIIELSDEEKKQLQQAEKDEAEAEEVRKEAQKQNELINILKDARKKKEQALQELADKASELSKEREAESEYNEFIKSITTDITSIFEIKEIKQNRGAHYLYKFKRSVPKLVFTQLYATALNCNGKYKSENRGFYFKSNDSSVEFRESISFLKWKAIENKDYKIAVIESNSDNIITVNNKSAHTYDPATEYVVKREKAGRPRKPLTEEQKNEIRSMREEGLSINEIAKKLNISNRRVINAIKS